MVKGLRCPRRAESTWQFGPCRLERCSVGWPVALLCQERGPRPPLRQDRAPPRFRARRVWRCDEDGTELRDLDEAREEASQLVAQHFKEHPREPWAHGNLSLIVQDGSGLTLLVPTVAAIDAVAVGKAVGP